jgi:PKD repeat protein
MFVIWNRSTLIFIALAILVVGCNDGTYSNPTSPPTTQTEWRAMTVTDAGATFSFSDIGAYVSFPAGTIPTGEVYTYNIRLNPEGVPMIPTGPVYYRLGTFELVGSYTDFLEPVEVQWRIAEQKRSGLSTEAFWINDDGKWEWSRVAVVLQDGIHVATFVPHPGVYGSFLRVPLHVEATASMTQGPVPLSIGLKAIITGGTPPYSMVWDFGDDTDPQAGVTVAHSYVDPGTYTITCMVADAEEIPTWVSDWIIVTAYSMPGPHDLP